MAFSILAAGLGLALGSAAHAQTENFDSTAVGALPANWSSTSTGPGAPWTVTNTQSRSAPNSAFTNDVVGISSQYLVLPTVNALGPTLIDLWYRYTTENTYDGWTIEAQINGGGWNNIGQAAWTTGGYNATISANFQSPILGQRAFSGTQTTWTRGAATLNTTNGQVVELRVNMSSDTSVASTGVWLDDITVTTASNFGACCDATGACTQNSQTACTSGGGFFFGLGNACSTTTCPVGACCNSGTCAMKISNACTAGGGSFFAGGSCTADFLTPAIGSAALEDISSTSSTPGTAFALTGGSLDDGYQMNIPLDFTFNFYGVPQTSINIATNGIVYFGGTTYTGLPAPTALPSANTPVNVIAPYWSDLVLQSTDQITYATAGAAPFRRFIVQWNNIPRYNGVAGGTGSITAQVVLYEGADAVSFRYGALTDGAPTNPNTSVGVANSATQATNIDPNSVRPGNTSAFLEVGANPCSGALPTGSCCSNGCQQITYSACLAAGGAFNGNGTTCASAPCNSGACCGLNGACTLQVAPICAGASGVYQGNGTACGATPCPASGRCCSGTTCGISFQANCTGVFTAGITSCTPNTCAGSCCDASGLCTLVTSAGACSGTFGSLGTSCSPSPCPGQSCASPIPVTIDISVPGDLAASVTTSTITCSSGTRGLWYSFTAAADATYAFNSTLTSGTGNPSIGIFGPCGTQLACQNPCAGTSTTATLAMTSGQQVAFRAGGCGDVQLTYSVTVSIAVVGACCNDTSGACTTTSSGAAGCAAGTTYMGQDSVCSAALCGQGACCNDSTAACTVTTAVGCTVGTFQTAGSTCATVACPTVACCDAANGTCSIVGPTGVCPGTSTPQGTGTSCTPNNCPQPPTGACCNTSNGACTQVFAVNCDANTSTYGGNNTTCDASGFCPGIGTCCSSLGNCVVLYSGSCPSGLTPNASLTCTANLCPAVGPHTCENFDSGSAGSLPLNWTSATTGAGAAWVIDTVHANSGANAVFTNDVATVSTQTLVLPDVVSGPSGLTLDFLSYSDTEGAAPNFYDGWVVEYSTDGGATWTDVAVGGSWVLNGYNAPAISANFASAIAGRPAFSGALTSWTERIATIPAAAGQTVSIRFLMASDQSLADVGVWLDDICVGGIQSTAGGVCCRGMTCVTSFPDAAACAAATPAHAGSGDPFYKFIPAATVCNTPAVPPATIGDARTPCCFANYNHNSGIEVQDIFDFLNDWLAGRAIAVPGGDGTSTSGLAVQNIFDFLNSWFAGGCS